MIHSTSAVSGCNYLCLSTLTSVRHDLMICTLSSSAFYTGNNHTLPIEDLPSSSHILRPNSKNRGPLAHSKRAYLRHNHVAVSFNDANCALIAASSTTNSSLRILPGPARRPRFMEAGVARFSGMGGSLKLPPAREKSPQASVLAALGVCRVWQPIGPSLT